MRYWIAVQMTGVEGLGFRDDASVVRRLMLWRTVRRDSAGVSVSMLAEAGALVSDGGVAPFVDWCARA